MCLPNIHWRNNIKPSTEIEKKGIFIWVNRTHVVKKTMKKRKGT
jgi:hypothetical protein